MGQHNTEKREHTTKLRAGLETTILLFDRSKTISTATGTSMEIDPVPADSLPAPLHKLHYTYMLMY